MPLKSSVIEVTEDTRTIIESVDSNVGLCGHTIYGNTKKSPKISKRLAYKPL